MLVIANNHYAYSTPIERQFAFRSLLERAAGYGIQGQEVDGTQLSDCLQAVGDAVSRARAGAGPHAEGSVDELYSNLCLQWLEDLPTVFAGFRRVLRPGGQMGLPTFGPDTLWALREAFSQADSAPHVSPFASIAQLGDALIVAGIQDPVLDRDEFHFRHDSLGGLMRELRTLGATNALSTRRRRLTGRARFARAAQAYEAQRVDAKLPATWEVITAHAWGPPPGTPIRVGGMDEVAVPVDRIPIRRRG